MQTFIRICCPNCKLTALIPQGVSMSELSVGEEITSDVVCPKCKIPMGAPGGHYKRGGDGILVRIGDYIPLP